MNIPDEIESSNATFSGVGINIMAPPMFRRSNEEQRSTGKGV